MTKQLTAEEILAAEDLPRRKVDVPEWGGFLYVRTMEGSERDEWETDRHLLQERAKKEGRELADWRNLRADLVARTACDEKGKLLFTPEQAAALGRKSVKALDRVFNVARKMNGITKEDEAELAGNSGGGPSDGSGSA